MCSMASRDQNRKQTLVVDSIEYTLAVRALIAALTATVDLAAPPPRRCTTATKRQRGRRTTEARADESPGASTARGSDSRR